MLKSINKPLLAIITLIIVGFSLQLEYGPKANTLVRIIDLFLNFLVIIFGIIEIRSGSPLQLLLGFLVYRSIVNILPVLEVMVSNFTMPSNIDTVEKVCLKAREHYNVIWERSLQPKPCIYLANHALWCLDDIVALGAISSRKLSIVININPSLLSVIPVGCREYMCTIDRERGDNGEIVKGSGFSAMKTILQEEVLEKGKSLIIFPENMKLKTDVNKMAPLRSGVVKLARELEIPLVPIWITWPSQFPTILTSTDKVLRIQELPLTKND
jgi:hypothetical protein